MDLPINIVQELGFSTRLPHAFLNYLLSEGYQFDQGILCLKISNQFGHCYSGMTEFKADDDGPSIDVGIGLNQYLNTINGEYVHVQIEPIRGAPKLIKVQGHRDSFEKVTDIKEQLEHLLVNIRILNKGCALQVSQGIEQGEQLTIVDIIDHDGQSMEWGLTIEADVEVDFMKTKEAEVREAQAAERAELEKRGFRGEGQRLGGSRIDRQTWLDRISGKRT